jgi:hypothetical protein
VIVPLNFTADLDLQIRIRGYARTDLPPQRVTIDTGRATFGPLLVTPDWQTLVITTPASAWRAGVNRLRLSFDMAGPPVRCRGDRRHPRAGCRRRVRAGPDSAGTAAMMTTLAFLVTLAGLGVSYLFVRERFSTSTALLATVAVAAGSMVAWQIAGHAAWPAAMALAAGAVLAFAASRLVGSGPPARRFRDRGRPWRRRRGTLAWHTRAMVVAGHRRRALGRRAVECSRPRR